ncbi:MAG: 1-acyl-sn-glycerol-3-phosphate acyltransferase [Pseudomonadales bacterium]|nr:1-acyl-sn-glycerol-3-phosphate acyltransferase [Pseudomonadales bacterium]
MTIGGHLTAAVSLAAISLNLVVWSLALGILLLARVAGPSMRARSRRLSERIYRRAVAFDDWCLQRISGVRWRVPELDLHPERACIVVANHRSWSDVFLLQTTFCRRGPIIKFLCKRELAYIPVLGLIFVAFDFPIVRRRARGLTTEDERRADDRRRVRDACTVLHESPAAMLSFAEGTRFTPERGRRLETPYRFLLPPRSGGFAEIASALRPLDVPVVDVTIAYPRQTTFWEFLGGAAGEVSVVAERFSVHEVLEAGPASWLVDRWHRKDAILAALGA